MNNLRSESPSMATKWNRRQELEFHHPEPMSSARLSKWRRIPKPALTCLERVTKAHVVWLMPIERSSRQTFRDY